MKREEEIADRVFKWSLEEETPPYECRLNPTNKCNLACLPCVSRGKPVYNKNEELTKSDYIRIIGEAAELGVQRFDICGGGEPLCSPDTIFLMEEIKKHGLKGSISTNGTMITKDLAKRLVKISWDELRFSINGPDESTDDYLRGMKGAFNLSVKAIQTIVSLKRESNKNDPNIIITPIITSLNYNKIIEFIELTHDLGASTLTLQPFMPEVLSGFVGLDEKSRRDISDKLKLSESERKELQSYIKEAKKIAENYGIITNLDFLTEDTVKCNTAELIKSDSEQEKDKLLSTPCYQPWWVLDINVEGGVGPCPVTEVRENVKEKKLSEIWYGDFFNSFREELANRKIPLICKSCCVISFFDNQKIRDILSDLLQKRGQ